MSEREFMEITARTIGRHSDVVRTSICNAAVKKEALIDADTVDPSIYVRTECDECGILEFGEHTPHKSVPNQ